jgi:ATP-binding cassette, subfamily C (CFTR/MRP), member 1
MADKDHHHGAKAPDPIAASAHPNDPAPEVEKDEILTHDGGSSDPASSDEKQQQKASGLIHTKSYATDASVAPSTTVSRHPVKKPWYKTPNPLRWGGIPPVPEERIESREHKASFFSLVFFQWMAPIMTSGYKRPLEQNDIWRVNPDRAADKLTEKMRVSFDMRRARGDKYPLLWAMHETFVFEFWLGAALQVMSTIFQVMSPFTLRFLIQFANDAWVAARDGTQPPPIAHGIGLVLGVTAMQILQSLGTNHFIYRGMMIGGQSRAVLISMVFEKAMVISGRAKAGGLKEGDATALPATTDKDNTKDTKGKGKGPAIAGDGIGWGNGRIVNLMSTDTHRIDQASALFHLVWTAPLSILITLVMLCINLGYSALAGFALLVIGIPLLTMAIRSLFRRRKGINKITDQRVSLTQEVLSSVRFVKFFGWESAFLARLKEIRKSEIHAIQILLSIRNAINAISMSMPIFASTLAFITYSLTDNAMAPAQVFSSLALFNGLRMPLNLMPLVLGQVVDAWSSIKRIQEFLLAEEQQEDVIWKSDGKNAVEMRDAGFTWERTKTQDPQSGAPTTGKAGKDSEKQSKQAAPAPSVVAAQRPASAGDSSAGSTLIDEEREPFKLQGLDFEIGRDELVAVIGTVGCGKSSLLAALAGDMRKTSGEVMLGARRAFCPQYAWIQNATVRDNIVFGKELDKEWYDEVIDACALRPDLAMLPQGDSTEIGERGITISGGQKQRLNIARAIYYDADIVLMDDPLSAVDSHTGRHIFDKAILGLLGGKCRVLATHQLWVLHRVDRIIWMEGGKIMAVDTFDNLMRDSAEFRHLLETTATEDEKDDAPQAQAVVAEASDKTKKKKGAALMQQEERAVASVPWSVYDAYIRASGSMLNAPIVFAMLLLALGVNIVSGLWLSWWTSDSFGLPTSEYIGVYAAFGIAQTLLMFAFSTLLAIYGTRASKVMLRVAVTRVLRAPMSFFDTTPLGRITNRFGRDVDVMDNQLTE